MVRYKCWVCQKDLESPKNMIGIRQPCQKCETPNLVPKPLDIDSFDDEGKCFLCRKREPDPKSSVKVIYNLPFQPSLQCRKCGATWKESLTGKANTTWSWYSPSCKSCGSSDFIATNLPAMPVGKYLENSYDAFNGVTFQQSDGRRDFCVSGSINVPRCHECIVVHDRIRKISRGIAVGAMIVIGGTLAGIARVKIGHLESAFMILFSFVVVAPIAWAISRVVLRLTIGRNIQPERKALEFPPLQALKERDWLLKIFSIE